MPNPEDASSEVLDGTHQLAAVMFTDVVSFSSQTHANEEETLKLVAKDIRRIYDIAEKHSGRVLKTMGDGVLIHFQSATDAVRCGLEFQTSMQGGFGAHKEKSPLQHRVGIHLGDMYVSESEVMGDGVNIASRLQTIAEPGGICISQTVYDIIKHKVALKVTHLGAKELKNISHAVNVYKIIIGAIDENTHVAAPEAERRPHPFVAISLNKWKQLCLKQVSKLWKYAVAGSGWLSRKVSKRLKTRQSQVCAAAGCVAALMICILVFWLSGGNTPQLQELTISQVEMALDGKTVEQGQFLFVKTKKKIRRRDILALVHQETIWNKTDEQYDSTYKFVLRVLGGRESYRALIGHDGAGQVEQVRITRID